MNDRRRKNPAKIDMTLIEFDYDLTSKERKLLDLGDDLVRTSFENTIENIKNLAVQSIVGNKTKDSTNQKLSQAVQQAYQFVDNNEIDYTAQTFFEIVAHYYNVSVDALNDNDKEFINEMLEDFEDTGKLYQKSDAARRALGNHQQAQRQEMIHQQREQETQKHQELTEFWNGVADIIEESREFAGLRVTEKDKGAFFQYLSSPVNQEGHTQRDIDHEGADMVLAHYNHGFTDRTHGVDSTDFGAHHRRDLYIGWMVHI